MQIKKLRKKPYRIVIFLILYISFLTIKIFTSGNINIINLVGYIVQLFIYSGLIYYIVFINNILLKVEKNDGYISLYHNTKFLYKCLASEITTDNNRFAYFFDGKFILLTSILNLTSNRELISTILATKKDIKIINEKKLFFSMFFKNIYFKIYILIFLTIPIIAIIQSIG